MRLNNALVLERPERLDGIVIDELTGKSVIVGDYCYGSVIR